MPEIFKIGEIVRLNGSSNPIWKNCLVEVISEQFIFNNHICVDCKIITMQDDYKT